MKLDSKTCVAGELGGMGKLVHEQLALQLTLSRDAARESALQCSWFFFELMIKVKPQSSKVIVLWILNTIRAVSTKN
jgi:hypothetical protein